MNIDRLDASQLGVAAEIYEIQLYKILAAIQDCFSDIRINSTLPNDENGIRDYLLLNYLKSDSYRENTILKEFLFDREVSEDHTVGRTDLKVQSQDSFRYQRAYYIIECKRLDSRNLKGKHGLNSKYVSNGIDRFVSEFYSFFYDVNGMIAFIVEDINIIENTDSINQFLDEKERLSQYKKEDNIFVSIHKSKVSSRSFKLIHLMVNCSSFITHS